MATAKAGQTKKTTANNDNANNDKKSAPTKKTAPATKAAPAKSAPVKSAMISESERVSAPSFELVADDGTKVSLKSLAGKKVVLYFYPKDNTPGCTREACAFQDKLSDIKKRGAVVIGVSRDSSKSHQGFKTKYELSFPLLSDPDVSVHKAFGAYGMKTSYGKTTEGVLRSTVIIDEQGRIAKRFATVKVDGHADQVLAALESMG